MKAHAGSLLNAACMSVAMWSWLTPGVNAADVRLSPQDWPAADLEKYGLLNLVYDLPRPLAEADTAMIGGTSGPLAIHAGLCALRQGGSAADAAIATSLAQIVLTAGSWNSFAGIFYMVYYDAASQRVYSLNAGYNTVLAETEPLTIPSRPQPSGRTALAPGFMAGVEAAHKRFGCLPFEKLFEPSVHLAERGFVVDARFETVMAYRKDVLTRLPEARAVFTKPDGALYRRGDQFRQPQLARTLRKVASDGAGYMYTGDWARRFVDAVRSQGGRITLDDMKRYQAQWDEPLSTSYGDCVIKTLGLPEQGAVHLIEAMNLLEFSKLKDKGHYTTSAEALYWFIQICRLGPLISVTRRGLAAEGEGEFSPVQRVKKESAALHWERLQKRTWQADVYKALKGPEAHSDAVVAVDSKGNVAAVTHTINTTLWGTTGIFVDGVSIPDSASFQQQRLAAHSPGSRFLNVTNPVIVLKQGKPFLAASAIGAGLHECMVQNLVNVLDFGMNPKAALETPNFWGPASVHADAQDAVVKFRSQTVARGEFDRRVLDAVAKLGQPIEELSPSEQTGKAGHWVGIQLSTQSPKLRGSVSHRLNGIVEGY